jgi:microcin C transport system ATP-binding protein
MKDLSVAFGNALAVDHVSFNVKKGETFALVGESGSGKSVTALSVLQLLPYPLASHPSGSIKFQGEEMIGAPDATLRRIRGGKISMIFQEPMTSLNPLHRVEQQITEVLFLHRKVTREQARARALELLKLVGINNPEQRLRAFPHEMSGGQRQRVMIAMALANDPDLLIADEPTTALDVTVQAQILKLLRELQARLGMAILLITHESR